MLLYTLHSRVILLAGKGPVEPWTIALVGLLCIWRRYSHFKQDSTSEVMNLVKWQPLSPVRDHKMSPRATEEDRNLGQYRSKNSKEDFASASDNGKPIVDIMSETNENRIGTLDPRIVLLKVGGTWSKANFKMTSPWRPMATDNKRRAWSSFNRTLFLITKEGSKLFNIEITASISSWMHRFGQWSYLAESTRPDSSWCFWKKWWSECNGIKLWSTMYAVFLPNNWNEIIEKRIN